MSRSPGDGFLVSLYDCVTREDALPAMLALLAHRFACRSGAFLYVDRALPEADVALGHGVFDAEAKERYERDFAHLDPMPGMMARVPVGRVVASDRLFTPEEIAALPFIRDFYHPLGLREALGGPILNENGRFGIVAVHRGPEREPFRTDEIRAFEDLVPHLSQVIRLRRRFFEIEDGARHLGDALDATAAAVLVVSETGGVRRANAAARAVLARGDGLVLGRTGRLAARDAAANRRLGAALREAAPGEPVILPVPRGTEVPYGLRIVAPARPGRDRVVQICDPTRPVPDPVPVLMAALGLSRPSARLVAGLLRGDDLKDHARREGLSVNTIKYHLKSAFDVTQTRRQVDLVRVAAAVARDFGIPDPVRSGSDAA